MPVYATLLVVDDDPEVREMLADYLGAQGYRIVAAADAVEARMHLRNGSFDLALVDIALPGEDGLSLARHIRQHYPLAIIMLSALGRVVDRIAGLETGADDYLAKPFDPRELLARIRSVLRRASHTAPAHVAEGRQVRIGRCLLDLDAHKLLGEDGQAIALTRMEFDLLQTFARHPNRVLSRDQILNLTQHRDWDPYDRSVDIRIARLRKKIEPDPDYPQYLRTVRGAGYLFVPEPGKPD